MVKFKLGNENMTYVIINIPRAWDKEKKSESQTGIEPLNSPRSKRGQGEGGALSTELFYMPCFS